MVRTRQGTAVDRPSTVPVLAAVGSHVSQRRNSSDRSDRQGEAKIQRILFEFSHTHNTAHTEFDCWP
jgi:hypothetical protein